MGWLWIITNWKLSQQSTKRIWISWNKSATKMEIISSSRSLRSQRKKNSWIPMTQITKPWKRSMRNPRGTTMSYRLRIWTSRNILLTMKVPITSWGIGLRTIRMIIRRFRLNIPSQGMSMRFWGINSKKRLWPTRKSRMNSEDSIFRPRALGKRGWGRKSLENINQKLKKIRKRH